MRYDGSINIDTRIDTDNLNNGTQETENTIEQAARQAVQEVRNATEQIETQANETSQRIQNILNDSSRSQRSQAMGIASIYRQQGMSQQEALERAWVHIERTATQANENINNTTRTTSNRLLNTAERIVQRIRNRIGNASEQTREQINGTVNHLENTFNGLKSKILATFSVVAITNFSKACLSANQTQIEAEARLGATMRNTIKATKEEIQSVKDLASELQGVGIVGDEVQLAGMQELATYVENAESLKTMLPVLDDMIAQQYGYNATTDSAVTISTMLGKVLQGQTSALSRYGYSFDEAQEKLLKYGTEEERVATLAQVVSESVGGVNKALADTPTGKMKQLSNDFGDLQETLGNLISNIIAPVVKWLDVIVVKLNNIFSSLNQNVKGFFGISDKDVGGFSDAVDDIAESVDNAIGNIDKTEKSVKNLEKNLAGIDKLNVLGQEKESDNTEQKTDVSDLSNLTSAISNTENTIDSIKSKFTDLFSNTGLDSFLKEIQKGFESVNWNAIKTNIDSIFSDLKPIASASFKGIEKIIKSYMTAYGKYISGVISVTGKSLQTVTGGIAKWLDKDKGKIINGITLISDNISSGIDNIGLFYESVFTTLGESIDRMRPTMETAIADCLSGFTTLGLSIGEVLSGTFSIVTEDIAQWAENNKALLGSFFDGTQQNMALFLETIGHISDDIGSKLSGWWEENGAVAFDSFVQTLLNVGATVMSWYTDYIQPVIDWIINSVRDIWDNSLSPLWNNILDFISSVMEFISALWNFIKPYVDFIAEQVFGRLTAIFKVVWGVLETVFKFIVNSVSNVIKTLKGLLKFFTGIFTGDFDKALDGIKDMIKASVGQVWNIIKSVINIIIDGINALWVGAYNIISGLVNSFSGIAETVGSLFGQDWSFRMPAEAPLIPKLATGTVVPASYGEFMAILGDNKKEPEIVSPVSAMKQAFKEAMAEMSFTQNANGEITVVLELDGNELFRKNVELNQKYKKRHGGRSAFA